MSNNTDAELMKKTIDIVLQPSSNSSSTALLDNLKPIQGYDLNKGLNFDAILDSYSTIGFQATNFSKAIDEINRMVSKIIR